MTGLRLARADDFDFFYAIKCEEKNMYWTGHLRKPDRESLRTWFSSALERSDRETLIFEFDGAAVGYAYVDHHPEDYETSLAVSEQHEGRGFGSQIVAETVAHIRRTHQPKPIIAWVIERNVGSVRVHERAGYRRTGKIRRVPFGAGEETSILFARDP
jgi:RimJ/RimL family protein N-acetyltransferase